MLKGKVGASVQVGCSYQCHSFSLSVYTGHSCETSGVNQIKCLWFAANKTELIL